MGYSEIIQLKHFEVPYSAKWPIEVPLNLKVTPFCEVALALLWNYTTFMYYHFSELTIRNYFEVTLFVKYK